MADASTYHHSVMHYHSPFPLSHRNARAFPKNNSQSGPWGTTANEDRHAEERYQQAAENNDYSEFLDTSVHSSAAKRSQGNTSPSRRRLVNQPYESDHMYLSRMEPQRSSPHPGDPTYAGLNNSNGVGANGGGNNSTTRSLGGGGNINPSSSSSFIKGGNPIAHYEGQAVSVNDSHAIWNDHKFLRFGVHRRKKEPYVTPDEFVDPLRCTNPRKTVPCGYYPKQITGKTKFPGQFVETAIGYRRANANAQDLPQKIGWHNPFNPNDNVANDNERDVKMLKRLPVTPLLEEVEERLHSQGFGSIVDVRFASDSAISELLLACGFAPTQRMTILWELRRRYPLPPERMLQHNSSAHGHYIEQ